MLGAVHRAVDSPSSAGHALASQPTGGSQGLGGRRSSLGALGTPRLARHALGHPAVHAPTALATGRVVRTLGRQADPAPGLSPGRLA
jgi:hypothetical protein